MKEGSDIERTQRWKSQRQIAKLLDRYIPTTRYIITESEIEEEVRNKYRTSRPKKLINKEEQIIIRETKRDRNISVPKSLKRFPSASGRMFMRNYVIVLFLYHSAYSFQ
jgi:transposase